MEAPIGTVLLDPHRSPSHPLIFESLHDEASSLRSSVSSIILRLKKVAEFANVRKQLEILEDRLDDMVQPRLTDALSNRKVDIAQDLRGILIRIGRFKSLETYYTKVHLKPMKQLWEDFESKRRDNKLASDKIRRKLVKMIVDLGAFSYDSSTPRNGSTSHARISTRKRHVNSSSCHVHRI